MSLFAPVPDPRAGMSAPLADRMRPASLDEFVGQAHILGPGKSLRLQIERDEPGSLIFWGPPGVGKTTLAKIIARVTKAGFIEFSAVLAGIAEIKKVMADAERARRHGIRTIVFVDEIHRFNKAQQDAFLPYVEHGSIRLIGATTENPSFEIISALLSRCRVYTLHPLSETEVVALLRRALDDPDRGLGALHVASTEDVLKKIAAYSSGDARAALNVLELAATTAAQTPAREITAEIVADAMQRRLLRYDKHGEEHYNLISALHKSVRNSDPDASLYWLGRMLEAGEDPLFIARRLVRMAVEDIGLASPQALSVAIAARDAFEFLGHPEGDLALAEATVYLALAPKSNAVYTAFDAVHDDVEKTAAEDVPLHLRNAPTGLMKGMGYGKGYQYAHDLEDKVADMQCLPDNLKDRIYYHPTNQGYEGELQKRLTQLREKRRK
ncbi:MAG: replication-associated recombination protein A [Acidobacteriales bacterium]|nr:replication-associated recombination protein A [Terriglobales bacterium]